LLKIKEALRKKIRGSNHPDHNKIDLVSEGIPRDDIQKVSEPDPPSSSLEPFQTSFKKPSKVRRSVLRFDASAIGVSEIASQYYCEKQVELKRIFGEERTEEMSIGTFAHGLLLKDTEKIDRKKLMKKIASGESVFAREMHLKAKFHGNMIRGITDGVIFEDGRPVLLLEHKFSANLRLYDAQQVQAGIYCYLLQLMGFDTSRLKYAIVKAGREEKENEELLNIYSKILAHPNKTKLEVPLGTSNAVVYIRRFDSAKVSGNLSWAMRYWLKEREAVPTPHAGKCRVCQFKEKCEFSLA